MGRAWHGSKFKGVRYYEHETRKYGLRKDRYYAIRYQKDGQRREEGLGWASQGWTEQKAALTLAELKQASITGQGETTLAARRAKIRAKKEQEAKDNLTFARFFEETYFPQAKANKSQKSCRTEEHLYRLWISPVIGDKPLKKISPLDLERIKKKLSDAGRAPRSIHYCLATIRQVFNLARMLNLYDKDNPVSKVKKPSVDNRRLRFLTHKEADKLLETLRDRTPQLYKIALLSLHTGMRASEIFNLTWGDVDLTKGLLTLRNTKNGKTRQVFMTNEVKTMFENMGGGQHDSYVFTDRKGNRIKEISNSFGRIIKELGFNNGVTDPRQKVVFHTLRHTFASWLVENGTDLYIVKELMGHSTLTMTERYSHLGQNTLQEAVQRLDKGFLRLKNGRKKTIGKGAAGR